MRPYIEFKRSAIKESIFAIQYRYDNSPIFHWNLLVIGIKYKCTLNPFRYIYPTWSQSIAIGFFNTSYHLQDGSSMIAIFQEELTFSWCPPTYFCEGSSIHLRDMVLIDKKKDWGNFLSRLS